MGTAMTLQERLTKANIEASYLLQRESYRSLAIPPTNLKAVLARAVSAPVALCGAVSVSRSAVAESDLARCIPRPCANADDRPRQARAGRA